MKKASLVVSGVLVASGLVSGACSGTRHRTAAAEGNSTGGTGTGGFWYRWRRHGRVRHRRYGHGRNRHRCAGTGGSGTGGSSACDEGFGGNGGNGGYGGLGGAPPTDRHPCCAIDSLEAGGDPDFEIHTTEFAYCGAIPADFTCDGQPFASGESPELLWSGAPSGTLSYAIVLKDLTLVEEADPVPEVFNRAFHWVIWDIPNDVDHLDEGLGGGHEAPGIDGARQWGTLQRLRLPRPMPESLPGGGLLDSYSFTLYALDVTTIGDSDLPEQDGTTSYVKVMDDYLAANAIAATEYRGTSAAQATSFTPPVAGEFPCTDTVTTGCLEAP